MGHQNIKTSLCNLSKNGWVMSFFVFFRSVRKKLQFTVFLDHPVFWRKCFFCVFMHFSNFDKFRTFFAIFRIYLREGFNEKRGKVWPLHFWCLNHHTHLHNYSDERHIIVHIFSSKWKCIWAVAMSECNCFSVRGLWSDSNQCYSEQYASTRYPVY